MSLKTVLPLILARCLFLVDIVILLKVRIRISLFENIVSALCIYCDSRVCPFC